MKRLARQGQGVVQVEVGAGRRSMVELECYTGIPICVGVLRGRLEEVVNLYHFGGARSFRFGWISFLTLDLAWEGGRFSDWDCLEHCLLDQWRANTLQTHSVRGFTKAEPGRFSCGYETYWLLERCCRPA